MSVGDRAEAVLGEAKRIILSAPEIAIGYIVIVAGAAVFVDTQVSGGGGDLAINILSIAAGFFMMREFLSGSGIAPDGLLGGFGVYFGLSLLSGLGIGLGLLLLVVPGMILMIRWLPVYGIGMTEGDVTDSFGKAWAATAKHFWPLAIAIVVPLLMIVTGLAVIGFWSELDGSLSLPAALIGNALIFTSTVANTAIGLAAFSLLGDGTQAYEDVFL